MENKYTATHQDCEDCGHKGCKTYFTDGWARCFSCDARKKQEYGGVVQVPKQNPEGSEKRISFADAENYINTGDYRDIPERKLTALTCKHFRCLHTGDRTYYGYYDPDDKRTPLAVKIRFPDKKFSITSKSKDVWKDCGLFGQQLFNSNSSRYLTITEGEFDAMAAFQMTGSRYSVVSLKNGASGAYKDCQAAMDWLQTFEAIYICFDNDEAGIKAAKQVAGLLSDRTYIIQHKEGFKDACDYLMAGQERVYEKLFHQAKKHVPDEIINGAELWDEVKEPPKHSDLRYPYEALNEKTYGIRMKELVCICAGTGLGKSQFMREIIYHILQNTDANIGLLMLEEATRTTAESMMSLHLNKPLHLPTTVTTEEERREAFDATMGTGRFQIFRHFGSSDINVIVDRVKYMAKGMDCDYVFLDHVTMVVSAQGNADERQALDELMTKLRTAVEETGVGLFCISHLKRPPQKGHEEGAKVSISHLRGSGGIAHVADCVLALERNNLAETDEERNTTKLSVLKNRFSGLTGPCGEIRYDIKTGRLSPVSSITTEGAV